MRLIPLTLLIFCCTIVFSQPSKYVVAGPMLGHSELRTATIWMQFTDDVRSADIYYLPQNLADAKSKQVAMQLAGGEFNTATAVLSALEPGTTYSYTVRINNQPGIVANGRLTTTTLWQYRSAAPDFSFITGSCAYQNDTPYDRPGRAYGKNAAIFDIMAGENAQFMLWLGDNWYTREVDYYSKWGLFYRASKQRSAPELQRLLKAMPQYAIWDDHDYGPNDADKSYPLKATSREVFMRYWNNPSGGFNDQGIYTKLNWNDVDIFMLDDRWFRSNDHMQDSVHLLPNPGKKMLGDEQMEWLKNALLHSNNNKQVNFRIIAVGSQVLNPYSPWDCLYHFPAEYKELMTFIADNRINGVLFMSGDRHHSEIIRTERPGMYPLYDITVSPLTAGTAKSGGAEINNPSRVGPEIAENNYAKFSFTGDAKNRTLTVQYKDAKGTLLHEWSVTAAELTMK